MDQNLTNHVLFLTQQFTVLGSLNKKKLTLKSLLSKRTYGRRFQSIISFPIHSISLQGFHLAKLMKAKFFCLEEKSFWKAQQQTRDQPIELCKTKCIHSNLKLIPLS